MTPEEVEEVEQALRADAGGAVTQLCAELSSRLHTTGDWCALALAAVLALARVGVDDETVLQFLDRVGPLTGFEEDWRRVRIEVLRELELQRAAAPGVFNATAIEEVAADLAAGGVDRRVAYQFALNQARVAGLALRGPRLNLADDARALLWSVTRPQAS